MSKAKIFRPVDHARQALKFKSSLRLWGFTSKWKLRSKKRKRSHLLFPPLQQNSQISKHQTLNYASS